MLAGASGSRVSFSHITAESRVNVSHSAREHMNTGTFVFMIATYWVGGSGSMEGGKFLANGQVYRNNEFVAAHRTLPLGTILHVCLRRHCISVVVKDRGPFLPKMDIERRIDLSYGAAKALDMLYDGRQRVRVNVPMPKPRPEIESKWQEASSPFQMVRWHTV